MEVHTLKGTGDSRMSGVSGLRLGWVMHFFVSMFVRSFFFHSFSGNVRCV